MIKTIFSDLGDVLIFVRNINAGIDISKYDFFKKRLIRYRIKKYEKGKISTEEFYTWYGKKTGQNIDMAKMDERFEKVFSLNEDMANLLRKLKKDYRIIALSNTNEANYKFVTKKYDIMNLFDDYVLSYKVGSVKPEKKIYKAALEKALCKPEECLFIDDIQKFTEAAERLGMKVIHYKNHSYLEEKLKEFEIL